MDNNGNERLTITLPEFSKLAGISKNQAYMLAASDSLGVPVIHFGRRMVLPRKAVLAMLEGDRQKERENDVSGIKTQL